MIDKSSLQSSNSNLHNCEKLDLTNLKGKSEKEIIYVQAYELNSIQNGSDLLGLKITSQNVDNSLDIKNCQILEDSSKYQKISNNQSESQSQNISNSFRRRNGQSALLSPISNKARCQQDLKKSYLFQLNKQALNNNNNINKNGNLGVIFKFDIKHLQRVRKQIKYFYDLFTQSGRIFYFEQKKIRNRINDKCDAFEDKSNKFLKLLYILNQNLPFLSSIMKVLSSIPLIDPDGISNFIFTFIFCTYNTLFYIFYTLFGIFKAPENICIVLDYVTIIFWIAEILVKLNTSILINKQTISNKRKEIFLKYFKQRFFFDIVPLLMIGVIQQQKYEVQLFLRLIICIKFKNQFKDAEMIQKFFVMTFQNYYVIQLVNLIIKLFLIGHTIAYFYYIIGLVELEYLGEPQTWFGDSVSNDLVWWKLYLEALFWSLTLMITGSNTATTAFQQFYATFIMLFTSIVFGYILNVIGVILEEIDEKNEKKRKDLNVINEYMRQKKISKNLQKKVNNNIEYYYEKNLKKIDEETGLVLSKISKELNDQLFEEYSKQIISRIPLLKNNFSEEALSEIRYSFEKAFYLPNQMIHIQNSDHSNDLLFIVEGQGFSRDYCIKSLGFTKIIKIKRDEFINYLRKYEKDFETFNQIKDKFIYDSNFVDIGHQCHYCNQRTHLEIECPFVFFNKQHCSLKSVFQKNRSQERQKIHRKMFNMNSILNNKKVIDSTIIFLQDFSLNQIEENQNDILTDLFSDRFYEDSSVENQFSIKLQNNTNDIHDENDINNKQEIKHQISSEEVKSQQSSKKQLAFLKKSKNNNILKKDPFRSDQLNISPHIMHMNSRKNYFSEIQTQNSCCVQSIYQMLNDKISSENQKNMNNLSQITHKNLLAQNSQQLVEEEELSSLILKEKKCKKQDNQMKSDSKQEFQAFFTKKISKIKSSNVLDQNEEKFEWLFEKMQDFKYYYITGNSKFIIKRHNKFIKQNKKKYLKNEKKQ
ncbi:cation channel family protein (macronuclear) [Tetrahymena thermophila SB210]|uniref:Cation channel family protein n=1 Tax=Tetrahymena thermophila (strain SB210) TaxID=312017 RepID=Q22PC0_TETTS|nr:cation channel family protein [Tetrahymena thermophila SB210]EAR87189.2 cation channel family protein [Tetrahymena thermophila SB210]|eukprot:XP_001007434.2 cation channel family protein [Tetrahymena thermophila SB210]